MTVSITIRLFTVFFCAVDNFLKLLPRAVLLQGHQFAGCPVFAMVIGMADGIEGRRRQRGHDIIRHVAVLSCSDVDSVGVALAPTDQDKIAGEGVSCQRIDQFQYLAGIFREDDAVANLLLEVGDSHIVEELRASVIQHDAR